MNKENSCDLCKESFSDTQELTLHVMFNNEDPKHVTMFKCASCKKSHIPHCEPNNEETKNDESLRRPNVQEGYNCDICSQSFPSSTECDYHKRRCCKICKKAFSSHQALKTHVSSFHEKKRDVQCGVCAKSFCNKYTLKNHKREVHTEKKLKCKTCNKSFGLQPRLEYHIKQAHNQGVLHICNQCHLLQLIPSKDMKKQFMDQKLTSVICATNLLVGKTNFHNIRKLSILRRMSGKKIFNNQTECTSAIAVIRVTPSNTISRHILTNVMMVSMNVLFVEKVSKRCLCMKSIVKLFMEQLPNVFLQSSCFRK